MVDPKVTNRKPAPLFVKAARPLCPICGKPVYSSSGSHPQCCYRAAGVKQKG